LEDCVFCKIVNGEQWSAKVAEDEEHIAFMDIRPMSRGHTLVATKKHYRDVFEMREGDVAKLYAFAYKVAKAVKNAFNPAGLNFLQNNGIAAGQVVFHIHVHIIPRYEGDERKFKSGHGRLAMSREELAEIAKKINNALNNLV